MNNFFFPKPATRFLLVGSLGLLALSNIHAQDDMPASKTLAPGAYNFKMRLNPGTDVMIRISAVQSKAASSTPDPEPVSLQPSSLTANKTIARTVRSDVVKETQSSGENGSAIVRYYFGAWCAFDDPRKGLNVRHSSIGGVFFPLGLYQFPELLWAEPKTQQPDPKVKEGTPPIRLYQDGDDLLEVDAATQRPIRYTDGIVEWKYSYSEDSSPIVIPEKIEAAVNRVLAKRKR